MTISRGEKPDLAETTVNLEQVENMTFLDRDRSEVQFGDLYRDQKNLGGILEGTTMSMSTGPGCGRRHLALAPSHYYKKRQVCYEYDHGPLWLWSLY